MPLELTSRRSFITGLVALVAAPAIVRVSSLMPIRGKRYQYFPWGIVSDGHILLLYDQVGGANMVASPGGYAPLYLGPAVEEYGIYDGPKPLHFWGTRLLKPEEV